MLKIMFVCLGNICRSPMAELVLKHKIKKLGLENKVLVKSSATSYEEVGNPVYPPVYNLLLKKGVNASGKVSEKLNKSDYENYDLFIAMDNSNIKNMLLIFGNDPKNKIKKLLDYVGEDRDVLDPWYTRDFEKTYIDVDRGTDALIKNIIENYGFNIDIK